MSKELRAIIREQRKEIKELKTKIKELENTDNTHWSEHNDMEGGAMMISGAMKEDIRNDHDDEFEGMGMGGVRT